MSGQEFLIILLVGLIAGWLAGKIVRGTGYGLVTDSAMESSVLSLASGCCLNQAFTSAAAL
jgi:uncharacterized membrane protein YeaQ/YmgE (transglycosylase-associated protein family)